MFAQMEPSQHAPLLTFVVNVVFKVAYKQNLRGGDTARFTQRDISAIRSVVNVNENLMDLVRLAKTRRRRINISV